jgi:hypothetical protein
LDSEDLSTSFGPKSLGVITVGEWVVYQQSFVNTTLCSIGPGSTGQGSLRFYAVWCAPNWNEHGNGLVHLPSGTITINAGQYAKAAAEAGQAWDNLLSSLGIDVTIQTGTCAPSLPNCVMMETGSLGNPLACAATTTNADSQTGEITGNTTIRIPNNPYSHDRLVAAISHERGHLFGLDDKLCPRDKSVMWTPELEKLMQCPYDTSASEATTASLNDALPVARTVYAPPGQGSRATCPAQ